MDLDILASLSVSQRVEGFCPKIFYSNVEHYKVYVRCEIFTDVRIGNLILIKRIKSKRLELVPAKLVLQKVEVFKSVKIEIGNMCLIRGDVFKNEYYPSRIDNIKMHQNICEVLDCFGRCTWTNLKEISFVSGC